MSASWQGSGEESFFDWAGPASSGVDVGGGALIDLPIRYYRTDCFLGIFPADFDAVRDALPSSRLNPVRIGTRAAVGIVAFNYLQTGVGPYGEIGICALVTLDRKAPPALPLLMEARWPGFGAFVFHLPVTSRIARQAGRTIWGYPKFVADMAFEVLPEYESVVMREGGEDILSLTVNRRGRTVKDRRPLVTYTVRDGQLIRTVLPMRTTYQMGMGRQSGSLTIGHHAVSDELRRLGIANTPAFTKAYTTHSAILPEGTVVGPADRAYEGYAGEPRLFGTHTVRYDRGMEQVVTLGEPAREAAREAADLTVVRTD
jgi:hypothetical protein